MRVIVTGGDGYIGSHKLVELLTEGLDTRSIIDGVSLATHWGPL
jgi:UDP-glucose 4-epimerase